MTQHADNTRGIYLRLLRYALAHWRPFIVAALGMGLYAGADTALIWLIKPFLDGSFVDKNPRIIAIMPVAVLVLFFLRGVARFISNYGMNWVGRRVIKELRRQIFDHLLMLPAAYYDRYTSGSLLARLTYHVEQVATATTTAVTTLVRDGLTVAGMLALMFFLSVKLTLFALIVGPFIAILVRIVSRMFRRYNKRIQDSIGDVTHVSEEAIAGQRVVKAFGGTPYERDYFEEVNERNRRLNMKLAATKAASVPFVQFIAAFAVAGIIFAATRPELLSAMSPGTFVSFMGAMFSLLTPIRRLTTVNAQLQKGIAAAGDIFQLLEEPAEDAGGSVPLPAAQGDICFEDVGFSYPTGPPVLDNINLAVRQGETVAFVGRSGSGKSTLLSLLPRFYDPVEGRIVLGEHDIRDYRRADLRAQIAVVDQNIVLFNTTVAGNIAYGELAGAGRDAIRRAAVRANAWEFILRMPEGLDTRVGQGGVRLSGGQRQRVAIARALLKKAPILVLDEATAALDTESERYIQSALSELMQGRTTFVIAHRLSTVQNADRIVVMSEGRIVEQGRHQTLLARDGHYAALYRMQFEESAA
jgi:subfamily B ATP-binding cassette protein MsbA